MTTPDTSRSVSITKVAPGRYTATNARGGELSFGGGDSDVFTPVELLLAAIGGCSGIDVDMITRKRAEPDSFDVMVRGDVVRDRGGNHVTNIDVAFRVRFPEGHDGDAAREVLDTAIQRSHDRLCTVSRTVERETPVSMRHLDSESHDA